MALQCAWPPAPPTPQYPQLGPLNTRNACREIKTTEPPATVLDLEMSLPALLRPVTHPYLSVLPSRHFFCSLPALGCTVELQFSLSLSESWLLDLFEADYLSDRPSPSVWCALQRLSRCQFTLSHGPQSRSSVSTRVWRP